MGKLYAQPSGYIKTATANVHIGNNIFIFEVLCNIYYAHMYMNLQF